MSDKVLPTDDFVGVTIAGRYRIVSRLGAGGMGTAYRAWDEQAGVPVVIKVPKKTFLEDPKFAERFHREIRLLQGLDHPHVVPIVDVGDHDGLPCVAMRFLPGGSLSHRRLRDEAGKVRPNPPGMLHLWLPAVAEALDYVHGQGVVHRDVKPGNIFFDAYWDAFLGDFGIAKIVAESETFDREHTLTATNMGIGTPEYMAPEQFAPKAVIDGRTDQYALAVIVYELLAGTRPFTGTTANLVVEVTMLEVPPLSTKRRDLQGSLMEAVRRGLAKKPDERFANCREFAAAVLRDVPLMQDEPGVARLLCPACENILKLSAAAAGKRGRCPRCRKEIEAAADLSAFWLTSEERNATSESARGDEHEPASGPGTDPQDWNLLTPGPVTMDTPKQNVFTRAWEGMTPAVRWTTLAAAALVLAVTEAVIVHDWSTAGLQREVESLRAGLRKSQTQAQELQASNQKLQRENARLVDSSKKPADAGTEAKEPLGESETGQTATPAPPAEPAPAAMPAPAADPDQTLTNSIGMQLSLIPAGTFTMGDDSGEGDQTPAHQVTLTKPFYLGVYEVTNEQWKRVMGTVPSKWQDDDLPVEQVSWSDAVQFCQKLSDLPEERRAGTVYRLPTEAEWEYACRAGSTTLYPYGDDAAALGEYAWLSMNSNLQTHPVGKKKPNAWGLYDVQGNLWEWCSDRFGPYGGDSSTDPTGPMDGSHRVARGNGWGCSADKGCSSSRRGGNDPSTRLPYLGFRVARSQSVKYSNKPDFAAHREAAGWALRLKGSVDIEDPSGKRQHINSSESLPAGHFAVIGINLPPGSNIPAADFGVLRNLQKLEILGLGGIPVSDDVFDHISDLPSLKHLGVNWTQVTGAGLAKLKNARLIGIDVGGVRNILPALQRFKAMGTLESINFDRVDIPAEGFVLIGQMKTLKQLWFRHGLVPQAQLDFLRKELPSCKISLHQ